MTRIAYLHIGTHKTGTTSLQHYLRNNKQKLKEQGFGIVPPVQPGFGHWLRYARNDNVITRQRKAANEFNVDDVTEFRAKVDFKLDRYLSQPDNPQTLLFSDEGLCGLRDDQEIERIKSCLDQHCDIVKVIIYIRPQHELLISDFSQKMRTGGTPEKLFDIGNNPKQFFYNETINRWAAIFGKEHMIPKIFDRAELKNGDIIADYADLVGIDMDLLDEPVRVNESLSRDEQLFMIETNHHIRRFRDRILNKRHQHILNILEKTSKNEPGMQPSRVQAEGFFNQYKDVNEQVRAEWFPKRDILFNVNFDKYGDEEDNFRLPKRRMAKMYVSIINELMKEIEQLNRGKDS